VTKNGNHGRYNFLQEWWGDAQEAYSVEELKKGYRLAAFMDITMVGSLFV
jgi:hypothetical protein